MKNDRDMIHAPSTRHGRLHLTLHVMCALLCFIHILYNILYISNSLVLFVCSCKQSLKYII